METYCDEPIYFANHEIFSVQSLAVNLVELLVSTYKRLLQWGSIKRNSLPSNSVFTVLTRLLFCCHLQERINFIHLLLAIYLMSHLRFCHLKGFDWETQSLIFDPQCLVSIIVIKMKNKLWIALTWNIFFRIGAPMAT